MPAYQDRKTKRWRYRKWVRTPDGRRIRITGTPPTNTKAAAEHEERMHILRVTNPAALPAAPEKEVPTVREYKKTFLAASAADKPSSVASTEQILDAYILGFFGDARLDAIRQSDVDAFVAHLLSGGRGRKTVNNITSVLSSLLKYAARNRVIDPPDLSFFIDEDEAELVAVAGDDVATLVGATEDRRYRAAILLAADAGLRVGEVRGLRWGDLNELRRTLTVARSIDPRNNVTAPKNRQRRQVPISDRLWSALQELDQVGEAVIARGDGEPLGYYTMREALLGIYDAAGVTPPPKPWHCLRHTFGSELAARGVPLPVIQELMGHASITTTMRYVHVHEDAKRDAIRIAFGQHTGKSPRRKEKKPRKR